VTLVGVATMLANVPAASRAAPPESLQSERVERPLLLLLNEGDALGVALARALEIELNDVDVGLEQLAMVPPRSLRDRIEAAEALVRAHEALGLIWIEPHADGIVIHLIVADAGMVRRSVTGVDDPSAAIETAAVIVRHFALDLLAGRPIGLTRFPAEEPRAARADQPATQPAQPVQPGEGPAPAPTPLLGDRGRLRLQAGYVGQTWVRERAWEHGVEVNLGWRFANGVHVGAGLAISPRFEVELVHPLTLEGDAIGVAQLRVRRYPVAAVVGYQWVWSGPRLALDAQLRAVGEVIERSVFDPANVIPTLAGPVRVIPALEPRLIFEYLAIPQLAVFVALGLRASLMRVDYSIEYVDEDGAVIGVERPFQPQLVAPVVLAGVDMFF